ncbi:helix-turn-helix domain-containing protein [Pseudomonas sp. MLB6B]
MNYIEFSIKENITIQTGRYLVLGQCEVAGLLGRSVSTISYELRKNTDIPVMHWVRSYRRC